MSHLDLEGRLRFLHRLDEADLHRAVALVSVEENIAAAIPPDAVAGQR